jgi:hypothetical protein
MARILRTSRWLRGVSLGALLVASSAHGQTASSVSSQANSDTVTDILHRMSDRADIIFVGQVLAIRRPVLEGGTSGVVEVEFRVDQAIRGCTAGTTYILREWGGLWAGGSQRYRVGQRLLMLLHAPSSGGLSSPVDGLDGAIPIRQGSTATPLSGSSAAPALPYVDLRWLGVKLQRAVSYRTGPAPTANSVRQAAVYAAVSGARSSVAPIIVMPGDASSSDASIPAQEASVDVVLGLLKTWQKASNVAP